MKLITYFEIQIGDIYENKLYKLRTRCAIGVTRIVNALFKFIN